MQSEDRQAHWESVYSKKRENEVSWFEESPALSLELIAQVGATAASPIIDIGGGASRLVDNLLRQGFEDITVLDLSATALESAKARLGRDAARVHWIGCRISRGFGRLWRSEDMPSFQPSLSMVPNVAVGFK
jgi:2-polyprenyl-3-methyl-5-hydroxy-6-metoxy-1,4-benzoquinol methylase